MKPKISVVITCFNYGRYLEGCVQSVLGQTFQDFEIVIVNDGSTDETASVVLGMLPNNKIRYIEQSNLGQAKAKNIGLRNSRGEFIAFLDADDMWISNKLERQIELFSREQVGVVYSRATYISESGEGIIRGSLGESLKPKRGKVTEDLFVDNFVPFSSSIVRREYLDGCCGFDESLRMGIDWDLWLRLSTRVEFDYVDEPLLLYRVGHSGQMSTNTEERQRCSDKIMSKFLDAHGKKISKGTIKKAFYHTYCNRGDYFSDRRKWHALKYFFSALKLNPLSHRAYYGIVKMVFMAARDFLVCDICGKGS